MRQSACSSYSQKTEYFKPLIFLKRSDASQPEWKAHIKPKTPTMPATRNQLLIIAAISAAVIVLACNKSTDSTPAPNPTLIL